jgi:internalin A
MGSNQAYSDADTTIKSAMRSGTTEVNLSGRHRDSKEGRLTAVPPSLRQLTKLTTLDLSDNWLTSVPDVLVLLKRLTSLNLSKNRLRSLPDAIAHSSQLMELTLSDNQLASLPTSLGQLTRLTTLRLSNNHLSSIPESIGQLTRLRRLDLSNNQLTSLPDSLGRLTQLTELHLSNNQLKLLPPSLGNLTQLTTLSISDNKLMSVPEEIGNLAGLSFFSIIPNPLVSLPDSVSRLRALSSINLSGRGLTMLPEIVSAMTGTQRLNLSKNQLTSLPESISKLTHLRELDLSNNALTSLPHSWSLPELQDILLVCNQLATLPDWIADARQLVKLGASYNKLQSLPAQIGQLDNLCWLDVDNNELTALPDSVATLSSLRVLYAQRNKITQLPQSLADSDTSVKLDGNPLIPELAAAYQKGPEAVKSYLREFAKGSRQRYEAKLLILGDGNEGKTCVSRALRGLPFVQQATTRGVDVEEWQFPHPDYPKDKNKSITLNIWDFEGQEINHQTHQFFLTTDSLYLLVFKCRDQFRMDRAEYWLDTIRSRAPNSKVAIVITECESRTPYIPEDKLEASYGKLLMPGKWLFAIGCADNVGVPALEECLKRCAADLEFMGREWPDTYSGAESAIRERVKEGIAHIERGDLYDIYRHASIDEDSFEDVASSMATLGMLTQFPDCPELSNFIVLQPQWLTKAISEVMEDKQLAGEMGKIALQRMQKVWDNKGYTGLFAIFHSAMKEFELCYDLEERVRSCLVPLRFGYVEPAIPWTLVDSVKERRVSYKLNIHPPAGFMSRFIVKAHHMIVSTKERPSGIYWHNGVFLRSGEGPLLGEALCVFDSESRTLSVTVRAAFPQNLLEQIHAYAKAVFSFFAGVEPERAYGCIRIDPQTRQETRCKGMHSERRIYSAILKERILDCEFEFHDVDPKCLVSGLSSFGELLLLSKDELRVELDRIPSWAGALIDQMSRVIEWVEGHELAFEECFGANAQRPAELLQQIELKLREYLGYYGDMLDDREVTAAPGIFSLNVLDRSLWNPSSYFSNVYVLTPFCECDQNIHPCLDGRVEFAMEREWWTKASPWVARAIRVLSVGLQLGCAGLPLATAPAVFDAVKDDVGFMKELARHLELKVSDSREKHDVIAGISNDASDAGVLDSTYGKERDRSMQLALTQFLEEVAPHNYRTRRWGSLRRVRLRDNSYRWLCSECAGKHL